MLHICAASTDYIKLPGCFVDAWRYKPFVVWLQVLVNRFLQMQMHYLAVIAIYE